MSSKKSNKKQASKTTRKPPAKRKKIVSLAQYEAEAAAQKGQAALPATMPPDFPATPEGLQAAIDHSDGVVGKVKKSKRTGTSGLDAAVQVLAEAGEPLNTKTMVERMLAQGLWATNGKTPAATIYAAIITEIAKKGDVSRFRKTERGHFELTAAGIAARTAIGKEAQ